MGKGRERLTSCRKELQKVKESLDSAQALVGLQTRVSNNQEERISLLEDLVRALMGKVSPVFTFY